MEKAPAPMPDTEDEINAVAAAENRKRRVSSHIDETMRQRRRMPATFDDSDDDKLRYGFDTDEEKSDGDDCQTPSEVDSDSGLKPTDGTAIRKPERKEALEAIVSQIMARRAEQGKSALPSSPRLLSRLYSERDSDFTLPPPSIQDNSSSEDEPPRAQAGQSSISNHINAMMQQQCVEQTNWYVADVPFDSQQGTHKGYRYSDSMHRGLLAPETSSGSDPEAPKVAQLNSSLPDLPSRSPLTDPLPSTQEKAHTHDEFASSNSAASQSFAASQRYHRSIDEAWAHAQAQAQAQTQLQPQPQSQDPDPDSSDKWIHTSFSSAQSPSSSDEWVSPFPFYPSRGPLTKTASELEEQYRKEADAETEAQELENAHDRDRTAGSRQGEREQSLRLTRPAPASRPLSPKTTTIIECIQQRRVRAQALNNDTASARLERNLSRRQHRSAPVSCPVSRSSSPHSPRHAGWALGSRLLFACDPVFAPLSAFSPSVHRQVNDQLNARQQLDEVRRPARRPPIELVVGSGMFSAQYATHAYMMGARRRHA